MPCKFGAAGYSSTGATLLNLKLILSKMSFIKLQIHGGNFMLLFMSVVGGAFTIHGTVLLQPSLGICGCLIDEESYISRHLKRIYSCRQQMSHWRATKHWPQEKHTPRPTNWCSTKSGKCTTLYGMLFCNVWESLKCSWFALFLVFPTDRYAASLSDELLA